MKKIWTIESGGQYDENTIEGIFSTRENAEKVFGLMNSGECRVVEQILDPGVNELEDGLRNYYVSMDSAGDITIIKHIKSSLECYLKTDSAGRIKGHIWAKNDIHAIKIANEFRKTKGEIK